MIVLGAPQDEVERDALELVRRHAIRAMDAWHLAVAALTVPPLLDPGEPRAFASRDEVQRAVATELGFVPIYTRAALAALLCRRSLHFSEGPFRGLPIGSKAV